MPALPALSRRIRAEAFDCIATARGIRVRCDLRQALRRIRHASVTCLLRHPYRCLHMMQRYYFNLSDGRRSYPDPMGVELDGPDAARMHALEDAWALLESWMARSVVPWQLEVYDSNGAHAFSISLAEASVLIARLIGQDNENFAQSGCAMQRAIGLELHADVQAKVQQL
jgi:hypothetical protein